MSLSCLIGWSEQTSPDIQMPSGIWKPRLASEDRTRPVFALIGQKHVPGFTFQMAPGEESCRISAGVCGCLSAVSAGSTTWLEFSITLFPLFYEVLSMIIDTGFLLQGKLTLLIKYRSPLKEKYCSNCSGDISRIKFRNFCAFWNTVTGSEVRDTVNRSSPSFKGISHQL